MKVCEAAVRAACGTVIPASRPRYVQRTRPGAADGACSLFEVLFFISLHFPHALLLFLGHFVEFLWLSAELGPVPEPVPDGHRRTPHRSSNMLTREEFAELSCGSFM